MDCLFFFQISTFIPCSTGHSFQIDDKTRTMVKDYVARKRAEKNLPPETLTSDEMPADEDNVADDEEIRQKIQTLIEKDAPDLVPIEGYIDFD